MMISFSKLFEKLDWPSEEESGVRSFVGLDVGPSGHRHLAKDMLGMPSFLVMVESNFDRPPNVKLKNLHVEHGIPCRVKGRLSSDVNGEFSIIHCRSSDFQIQQYFLSVMEVVNNSISEFPTGLEVSLIVDRLASLFLAMQKPASGTVQGLWAELFFILSSGDPKELISQWRSKDVERYDFSIGRERLDVKSYSGQTRSHYFSLGQAYPPTNLNAYVASVFTEANTNGLSLGDLWDQVKSEVANMPRLSMKVDQVCMDTLGSSWQAARTMAYDADLAAQSIRIFNIDSIPKVSRSLPRGVTDVKFKSELTETEPVLFSNGNQLLSSVFGDED